MRPQYRPPKGRSGGLVSARSIAFAVAAGVTVVYALRGGTYDIVVRQESGVVAWWVLALGTATGVLPRARPPAPAFVVLGILGALTCLTAVSLKWTESDERTVYELARVVHHTGYFALAIALLDRNTWSAAAAGLATGAVGVCGIALCIRLAPDAFPADSVRASFGGNRLNQPLNYWNAVAAWGAMSTALALAWSAHVRQVAWRAAALTAVPVAVTVTYLTYSRAGAIGTALALVAVLAFSRNRFTALVHAIVAAGGAVVAILAVRAAPAIADAKGDEGAGKVIAALAIAAVACSVVAWLTSTAEADDRWRLPRWPALGALVVGLVAFAVAAAITGPSLANRGWEAFRSQDGPTSTDPAARLTTLGGNRYNLWASALDSSRDQRWKGIGPGAWEFWWNRDARDPEFVRDAHSFYLEAFSELGWPGLVASIALVLALLGCGVMAAVATRRAGSAEAGAAAACAAACAVFLFHAGVDWMWESTAVAVLALGLAAAAAMALAEPFRWGRVASRGWRVGLRAALVVVALVAIAVQLPVLAGTSRTRASQEAAAAGGTEAGVASQEAIEIQAWAATPYVQRALLAELAGDLEAAERDVRRAIEREPTNWRHPLLLARVLAERGRPSQALAAYRRGKALRPLSALLAR